MVCFVSYSTLVSLALDTWYFPVYCTDLVLIFAVHVFSYLKRFINWMKHKEETDDDIYTRWEKDYDLIQLSNHGLFFEYLELGECTETGVTTGSTQ